MANRALQLLIARGKDEILAQKFFTRKRKIENVKFEFSGGLIKGFVVSYNPRENALVLFVDEIKGE